MIIGLEEAAASIRRARQDKGLTQGELGSRVGLPQSHISKIETGAVDIQTSSLIEIARALDLEVKLVPRKALPAIEGGVKAATANRSTADVSRAISKLQWQVNLADRIRTDFPSLQGIEDYREALKNIQALHIDSQSLKALDEALRPSRKLAKTFETHDDLAKLRKQLSTATDALQKWRNIQVHSPKLEQPAQRPAYRLGDDE